MSSIKEVLQRRGINGLTHFTRLENLDSILMNGIVPRSYLLDSNTPINGILTDSLRLDGKIHASCFSVSFPNYKMFFSYRQSQGGSWVVICVYAQILIDKEDLCEFYPSNAASNNMTSLNSSQIKGGAALEAMFPSNYTSVKDPLDVQAEVMISGVVEPKYIGAVIFGDMGLMNKYKMAYPNLASIFHFHQEGSGFFAQRDYARSRGFKGL